jgi:hypothetical protein
MYSAVWLFAEEFQMKQTKQFFSLCVGLMLLLLTACQSFVISNSAASESNTLQAAQAIETEPEEAVLNDLDSLEELQEIFNRDAGKTRLVLLLSPT